MGVYNSLNLQPTVAAIERADFRNQKTIQFYGSNNHDNRLHGKSRGTV